MLAYYGTALSPNQLETDEGFLICKNVPIARIGEMQYTAGELHLDGDPERLVVVDRLPEDVFAAAALASFEGKPVTDGHPLVEVEPNNFAAYGKGHVQNVRRQGDYVLADLFLTDAALISDVQNSVKREVSCGYVCNYEPNGGRWKQTNIRGNHVAIVPRGRAGHHVAIKDEEPEKKEDGFRMSEFKKKLLTIFGGYAKDAAPEDIAEMVETAALALDAEPASEAQDAVPAEAAPADPETADSQEKPAAPSLDALDAKLEKLAGMLEQLLAPKEESKLDIDQAIKDLGGEEALTVPAEEAADACRNMDALHLLQAMRPAVAGIANQEERQAVTDALLALVQGDMASIVNATRDSALAKGKRQKSAWEIAEAQQEIYDALNPHRKGTK